MPGSELERRFPLPDSTASRVPDAEIVGAFYTSWDSGRDCRAVVSRSRGGHVRIDMRLWQVDRPVPTRQGITVALSDWRAFAELVAVVTEELVNGGDLPAEARVRSGLGGLWPRSRRRARRETVEGNQEDGDDASQQKEAR